MLTSLLIQIVSDFFRELKSLSHTDYFLEGGFGSLSLLPSGQRCL